MDISQIVTVNISKSSSQVSQKGFGRANIVGRAGRFTSNTARVYDSILAVAGDFQTTDPEYIQAAAYFSPQNPPQDVMISQIPASIAALAQVEDLTGATLDAVDYSVTLNGQVAHHDYTGGSAPVSQSALAGDFKTAIDTVISAHTLPLSTALHGTAPNETLRVTATVAGNAFTCVPNTHVTKTDIQVNVPHVGMEANLNLLVLGGANDWYGLLIASSTPEDILEAAHWTEAQPFKRIFGVSIGEAGSLDGSSTTDTGYLLKQNNYDRTSSVYDGDAALTKAATWMGDGLARDAGTSNWSYKDLPGETADILTDNQINNLKAKNMNCYVTVAGADLTIDGRMADGEWIDSVMGLDWVQATMQQNFLTFLLSLPKVPFTDAGIAMVCNVFINVLKQAVDRSILISQDMPIPVASDFTPDQKAARSLTGLKFTAQRASAVNKTSVMGYVYY